MSQTTAATAAAKYAYAFQDPELPMEQRIDDILVRMTIDEKVECLGTHPRVPRLGIEGTGHSEGLHGLAVGGPGHWEGRGLDPIPTTTFPQAIGLGETWDPETVRQAAAIEGYEARYIAQSEQYGRSRLVVRAPNADLGRDPRWGRTEECYGEDPYFNGVMTTAFVRGLQGDHPTYWQAAALLKHFLANSNEDGRERSSSDFDERLFREYYSVPFRMGIVDAGARAFMAAYNAYNGIPCGVHPVLKEVTVGEWGQDGIICTDGGAMTMLVTEHKAFSDKEQASAAVVKAGIGQFLDDFRDPIHGALAKGLLSEAEIDAVLRGVFRVMIRLGLLDPPERVPYATIRGTDDPWLTDAHRAVARSVTQRSVVLLKNDGPLLPLNGESLRSVAVIGPRADEVLLDWYSGTPPYTVTPLEGIRARAANADVKVTHADGTDLEAAADAARSADVAVVCVGNHATGGAGWAQVTFASEGKEAVDRRSLLLEQEELIRTVFAANPSTVVVLISSFPYTITWTAENVPAIVHLTHNSQETGNALADVLFGDVNPAGRLVQTWPRSIDDLPPMMDYDIRNGHTYLYSHHEPLYPFGHGLSYTTFEYANLRLSSPTIAADGEITVSVDVTNTGGRDGDEVVQLYVRHRHSQVVRPRLELKGFQRVPIRAGETRTVSLLLRAEQLAYWNVGEHRFEVEPGDVELLVGRSSAAIAAETIVTVQTRG